MNGWSLIFKVNSVFNLGKKKEKIHPKGLLQVIKQASVKHSEPPNVSPPKKFVSMFHLLLSPSVECSK